ncbi:hypothetical protein CYMTET_20868 [Cymbomonas tetramitiformis]|uniref:Uncharacterized protein n=1 Tax=Cymbomonas tetramitiformis TaxID=36881 RepID=A0AAE0G358_9CHLO|nr:hypothetical protein CYMTET_20868 [Cymbomonas tetramitiformis]
MLAAAKKKRPDPVAVLREHLVDVNCVAFHPEGHLLLSGDADGYAKLWDLSTRRPLVSRRLHGHPVGILHLEFITVDHFLSQGRDGVVKVWELENGTDVSRHPISSIPTGSYTFCNPVALRNAGTHTCEPPCVTHVAFPAALEAN